MVSGSLIRIKAAYSFFDGVIDVPPIIIVKLIFVIL